MGKSLPSFRWLLKDEKYFWIQRFNKHWKIKSIKEIFIESFWYNNVSNQLGIYLGKEKFLYLILLAQYKRISILKSLIGVNNVSA